MAYFGDTVAHAALLGVAFGVLFKVNQHLAVLAVCIVLAFSISYLHTNRLSVDTALGIFSHGSLAIGLLLISLLSGTRFNLQAVLMGEILAIDHRDLIVISCAGIGILIALIALWKKLLLLSIDEEICIAEGLDHKRYRLFLTGMIALAIGLGIDLVGALLVSAFLIIPAAAARTISSSPEAMVFIAAAISILASITGTFSSAIFDTPTGPSIVVAALFLFMVLTLTRRDKARAFTRD